MKTLWYMCTHSFYLILPKSGAGSAQAVTIIIKSYIPLAWLSIFKKMSVRVYVCMYVYTHTHTQFLFCSVKVISLRLAMPVFVMMMKDYSKMFTMPWSERSEDTYIWLNITIFLCHPLTLRSRFFSTLLYNHLKIKWINFIFPPPFISYKN